MHACMVCKALILISSRLVWCINVMQGGLLKLKIGNVFALILSNSTVLINILLNRKQRP